MIFTEYIWTYLSEFSEIRLLYAIPKKNLATKSYLRRDFNLQPMKYECNILPTVFIRHFLQVKWYINKS